MRKIQFLLFAMIIAFSLSLFSADIALAKQADVKPAEEVTNKVCPVGGEAVDPSVFVMHNGQKVYFCCADCKEAFEANPDKYMEKLKASTEEGNTGVKLQTTCPISGHEIDKNSYVDKDGQRIYTCCADCNKDVEANFDKYAKEMADKGITVAHLQSVCPIMGNPIDKEVYKDINGKRVYFCCASCESKMTEERMTELEAEGIIFAEAPQKEGMKHDEAHKMDDTKSKSDHSGHNH